MKKIILMLAVMLVLVAVPSFAHAGFGDWLAGILGYTPTDVYLKQVEETQFFKSVITYSGLGILALVGFAWFRRDKLASQVIEMAAKDKAAKDKAAKTVTVSTK